MLQIFRNDDPKMDDLVEGNNGEGRQRFLPTELCSTVSVSINTLIL